MVCINVTLIWLFRLGACELIHIIACEGKTAINMLKILHAAIVARAIGHPEFVHPFFSINSSMFKPPK